MLSAVRVDAGEHLEADDPEREPVRFDAEPGGVAVADAVHDRGRGEPRRLIAVHVDEQHFLEPGVQQEVHLVQVHDQDALRVDVLHALLELADQCDHRRGRDPAALPEGPVEKLAQHVRVLDPPHGVAHGAVPRVQQERLRPDDSRMDQHGQLLDLRRRQHPCGVGVDLVGDVSPRIDGSLAALCHEFRPAQADTSAANNV